jgi:DNA-binding NtrC family response regulator
MQNPAPADAPGLDADLARVRLERDLFLRLLELAGQQDVQPFLRDALALVVELAGARKGYLELADERGGDGRPRWFMAIGFSDEELGEVRRELSTGIVAEALATGRTISTASALDDPRYRAQASVQAAGIRAVLCAPVGSEPAVGVVYLQGRAAPGPFPEKDRAHVEMFAARLAPLADRLLDREAAREGEDHTASWRRKLRVEGLAGTSRALAEVMRQIGVAAPVPISVLLTGESGTGKTLVARALHASGARPDGPFVELNCAAIPEALFESELFGAERGAHSTATRRLEGKIDAARGGTLLLDEVSEIPLAAQGKLLGFLQSHRFFRLGGTSPVEADVRVTAATNADLEACVRDKRLREDLYYRLNVLEVRIPPLRERREDIVPIAHALLSRLGAADGRVLALSRGARAGLEASDWPGNVRQLENALARGWAVALSEGSSTIEARHLFPQRAQGVGEEEPEGYEEAMRAFQRTFLGRALEQHGWNVSETARRLGMARSHLNDLIRLHGLVRSPRT